VGQPEIRSANDVVFASRLFYVQHQFEQTAWERDERSDLHQAALYGSSHYDLPGIAIAAAISS